MIDYFHNFYNEPIRSFLASEQARLNHNNLLAVNKNNSRKRDLMKNIRRR